MRLIFVYCLILCLLCFGIDGKRHGKSHAKVTKNSKRHYISPAFFAKPSPANPSGSTDFDLPRGGGHSFVGNAKPSPRFGVLQRGPASSYDARAGTRQRYNPRGGDFMPMGSAPSMRPIAPQGGQGRSMRPPQYIHSQRPQPIHMDQKDMADFVGMEREGEEEPRDREEGDYYRDSDRGGQEAGQTRQFNPTAMEDEEPTPESRGGYHGGYNDVHNYEDLPRAGARQSWYGPRHPVQRFDPDDGFSSFNHAGYMGYGRHDGSYNGYQAKMTRPSYRRSKIPTPVQRKRSMMMNQFAGNANPPRQLTPTFPRNVRGIGFGASLGVGGSIHGGVGVNGNLGAVGNTQGVLGSGSHMAGLSSTHYQPINVGSEAIKHIQPAVPAINIAPQQKYIDIPATRGAIVVNPRVPLVHLSAPRKTINALSKADAVHINSPSTVYHRPPIVFHKPSVVGSDQGVNGDSDFSAAPAAESGPESFDEGLQGGSPGGLSGGFGGNMFHKRSKITHKKHSKKNKKRNTNKSTKAIKEAGVLTKRQFKRSKRTKKHHQNLKRSPDDDKANPIFFVDATGGMHRVNSEYAKDPTFHMNLVNNGGLPSLGGSNLQTNGLGALNGHGAGPSGVYSGMMGHNGAGLGCGSNCGVANGIGSVANGVGGAVQDSSYPVGPDPCHEDVHIPCSSGHHAGESNLVPYGNTGPVFHGPQGIPLGGDYTPVGRLSSLGGVVSANGRPTFELAGNNLNLAQMNGNTRPLSNVGSGGFNRFDASIMNANNLHVGAKRKKSTIHKKLKAKRHHKSKRSKVHKKSKIIKKADIEKKSEIDKKERIMRELMKLRIREDTADASEDIDDSSERVRKSEIPREDDDDDDVEHVRVHKDEIPRPE